MCWSWEISLFSALFNTTVIIYILNNKGKRKQKLAISIIPIILQEYIQAVQWLEIDKIIVGKNLNLILTNIVIFIVKFVPLSTSYGLYITSDKYKKHQQKCFYAQKIWFIYQVFSQLLKPIKTKTTTGENNLLKWPSFTDNNKINKYIFNVGYLIPCTLQLIFYKPREISIPLLIIIYETLIFISINTPQEIGGSWCISMTFLSLYILFYKKNKQNIKLAFVFCILHNFVLNYKKRNCWLKKC
jgi:hypothetical protein